MTEHLTVGRIMPRVLINHVSERTLAKIPAETPRSDQQSLISSFFVKNRPTEEK